MKNKRLMALVLTATVVASNISTGVMAETVNDNSISVLETRGALSSIEGKLPNYISNLTQDNLLIAQEDLANGTVSTIPDGVKTLTEGTIIIKFNVNGIIDADQPSLISFSNSNSPNNYFNIYFKKDGENTKLGFKCMINGVESPTGQGFSGKPYIKDGVNTLAISIKEGEGYSISLNNLFSWAGSNTNIKFLNSIQGLDTISVGKTVISNDGGLNKVEINKSNINIDLFEIYNKKINNTLGQKLGSFNLDNSYLDRLTGVSVVGFSSQQSDSESASKVLDRNTSSIWHTSYTGETAPHFITLDLGKEKNVTKLEYIARLDGANGEIKQYKVYASNSKEIQKSDIVDGVINKEGFTEVATGTIANGDKHEIINLTPTVTRYLTLVVLTSEGGWATASELYVHGSEVEVAPATPVSLQVTDVNEISAKLTWSDPTNSPEEISKYVVSNGTSSVDVKVNESGSYSYEITGLTPGTEYSYTVKAVGANTLASEATVNFTTVAVNKSDLQSAIESVEDLVENHYTTASWQVLEGALTVANNVLSTERVTQSEIDRATSALKVAISGLEEAIPSSPVVITENLTDNSVELVWENPSDSPEEIDKYVVSDGKNSYDVDYSVEGVYRYKLKDLNQLTEYNYTVKSVGVNGKESTVTAVNFTTLENTNGINGLTAPTEVKRFDTAQFKLNLGSDVSKVKVIYYWDENGIKNTYEEYYTVGSTGSLTVDRKLRFAREYEVEFIPMVNGSLQKDEAKKVDLNVVENAVGDVFESITGNGYTGSTNIQKVGDTVQFTIETALNVDRIQFKFVTSNNYIEYYNKTTNAQVVGDKLVWTIDRPIRTLREPHKLVISAMNEGYIMASSNFQITIGK